MRARSRIAILALAAILAFLLGFLLLDGGGPGAPNPDGAGIGPVRRSPADGTFRKRAPGPEVPVPDVAAASAGPELEIRARIEGEWPLPGVTILPVERHADGTLIAAIGEDAPESGDTDAEGSITLRYKTEPAERLFGVLGDDEVPDGADNAEPAGEIRRFRVYRALNAGPVTLRFRDPEGTALVRPVDAATGEVLSGRDGIRVGPVEPGSHGSTFVNVAPKKGGWLRVFFGDSVGARLHVPGYLPAPPPDAGWKGRAVVRMEVDPAAIRGRLVIDEGSDSVDCELHSAEDGGPCRDEAVSGLPRGPGLFSISGVPSGTWDLVVAVRYRDAARWATVRIACSGTGLDLGEVRPIPSTVLRVRVTRESGQAAVESIHVSRATPGELPVLSYSPAEGRRVVTMHVTWPGRADGDSFSRPTGDDGWTEFRGLQPGGTYLVATPAVPGLTREVAIPAGSADPIVVELDGGAARTVCTLRFTVDGKEPSSWTGFNGPAHEDSFSIEKGTLEADIPPGRYRILGSAYVGPVTTGEDRAREWGEFLGEVEIPAAGRFDATVDLQPAPELKRRGRR